MTSTSGDGPAAGWYPDPEHPDRQRYWDGSGWTEHRHPSTSAGPDDTAVLPQAEPRHAPAPAAQTGPVAAGPAPSGDRGGRGWVAALAGLIAGLVIGGTAAAVVVGNNNDDSSTPQGGDGSSAATAASTVTATETATATQTVTATATATATETVTVTTPASP